MQTRKQILKSIKKVLYKYDYDIKISWDKDCKYYKYNIIVRIPFLKISTILNHSRTLYDFELHIKFLHYPKPNVFKWEDIEAKRNTVFEEEYYMNYSHSHLSRGFSKYYKNFCEGGYYNNLKNTNNISLMLHSILNFIKYEDMDAGPYINLYTVNDGALFNTAYHLFKKEYILDKEDLISIINIIPNIEICNSCVSLPCESIPEKTLEEILPISKYEYLYVTKMQGVPIGTRKTFNKETIYIDYNLKVIERKYLKSQTTKQINYELLQQVISNSIQKYYDERIAKEREYASKEGSTTLANIHN